MNSINKFLIAAVSTTKQLRWMRVLSVSPIASKPIASLNIYRSSFQVDTCSRYIPRRHAGATSWLQRETRKEYALNTEEFKKAIDNDDVYVIDVREPSEVAQGRVPAKQYVNIPLGVIFQSLTSSNEEFEKTFGAPKPSQDENIVFMCLAGIRSTFALQVGQEFQFKNSKHYVGGWAEWSSTYPSKKM